MARAARAADDSGTQAADEWPLSAPIADVGAPVRLRSPLGGSRMHVHLPKPLHGWREFAGEVGIIVVGVLIALGAEQVVETIHWRNEVASERASLLQEATDSLSGVRARVAQQPCVDRRLVEIQTVLERHHRGEPLGLVSDIGRPTRQSATRGTWQIALAGQALAHMGHDEKLAFSAVFGDFDLWDKNVTEDGQSWQRLALLNDPDLLTEQDWSGIRAAYAEAVDHNNHFRVLAPWMVQQVSTLLPSIKHQRNVGDLSDFRGIVDQICKPALAPVATLK